MRKIKPLFVVAAGSGGHMIPALQWAKNLHNVNPARPIILITGPSALEQSIARNYAFLADTKIINIGKFSTRAFWRLPKVMLQALGAFIKSVYYAAYYRPSELISTGGLLTIPVAIAARLARCRVLIHELNVVPGKAVHFLLPWATTIFVCFEKTKAYCRFLGKDFSYKCVYKNYPVRFSQHDKQLPRGTIIEQINKLLLHTNSYSFIQSRITLLILGGSQGSVGLNNLCKKFITQHPELHTSLQIIHQTGASDQEGWNNFYKQHEIPALTFAFSDRIAEYYACSDILVSRAGAGSMFEALFFEKPTIIVPLVASSTSHQVDNAQELAQTYPHLFAVVQQQAATADQSLFDDALIRLCVKVPQR